MDIFLFIIAILAFVGGIGSCVLAKNAVHEIGSYILLLIFTVAMSGVGIIGAIKKNRAIIQGKEKEPETEKDT